MLTMILKMTLATVLYGVPMILLGLLWHRWQKRCQPVWMKILVGLVFGGCSVVSTHVGIDYQTMILNVRDIGPLAAGLFFSPLSGLLAGLIGGTERFIAGTYWNVGSFTTIACSLSTLLAGFLSAALHRWVYEGERPTVTQSFFLGAVMEVFHMYVVLITHRNEMTMATYVVQACAAPMIIFTGLGLAMCSTIAKKLAGETFRLMIRIPKSETPVYLHFQRWLLLMTTALFLAGIGMSYAFQTYRSYQEASDNLQYLIMTRKAYYETSHDLDTLEIMMNEMDLNSPTFYFLWESDGETLRSTSIDSDGSIASTTTAGFDEAVSALFMPTADDRAVMMAHLDGRPFMATLECMEGSECLCAATKLDDRYLMLCLLSETIYQSRTDMMYENILSDILVFTVLYVLIAILVDELVVKKLGSVNQSLARITDGHLGFPRAGQGPDRFRQDL